MELPKDLSERLLRWYDKSARVLPWRDTPTAYRVWVSEVMLQQTRVSAVIPYYTRFLTALPDTAALAACEEEKLMKLWEGLGYYNRARNLQKGAQCVMERWGGEIPHEYEDLLTLPGIGEYTAGAIASIAFSKRVCAVDGNVLRVLARLSGDTGDVRTVQVKRAFCAALEARLPSARVGDFNQSLMELGATVCLPNGAPHCADCPLADCCRASGGAWKHLPVKGEKAARRVEERTVFLLLRSGEAALRRREARGLLAGLWEYPSVCGSLDEQAAAEAVEGFGLCPIQLRRRVTAKHIFTHVEWRMRCYIFDVAGEVKEESGIGFVTREQWATRAIPSAFARLNDEAERYWEEGVL